MERRGYWLEDFLSGGHEETSKAKRLYLDALRKCEGRITDALRILVKQHITYFDVRHWREDDERFKGAEEIVREEAKEGRRDAERRAVKAMIGKRNAAVICKAMDSLPEYEKKSTVKHEGAIQHQHYELSKDEALELFKKAQKAIELTQREDGAFE